MKNCQIIDEALRNWEEEGKLTVNRDCPLSTCTTFRIGGKAEYVIYPYDIDTLTKLLDIVRLNEIKHVVLGNASNVLFSDKGFDGIVIFTSELKSIYLKDGIIHAECGATLSQLSQFAQKNGFTGLEFAYGIPGTCGGAVYMNAGAFTGEIKDVIYASTYYDCVSGEICRIDAAAHNFSYRHSIYTDNRNVILSAEFKVERAEDPRKVEALMEEYIKYRYEKQPLEYPSAGSVFKRYPGYYTSKLICDAGLKGCTVGGAQVSEKHAGFIINCGNATANDVLKLIDKIKQTIFEKNGIHIECEVKYIE